VLLSLEPAFAALVGLIVLYQHLLGRDIVADPGYARRNIGFLPQGQFEMDQIRVEELLRAVGELRGLSRAESRTRTGELLDQLHLGAFRSTPLHAASGGVRRLAGFVCAIIACSPVLVLDEPTNDVDPVRRQLLWNSIAALGREGTTVLLVTHNLAEAERVIGRFAIIDHGRILREGTPAAMRSLVSDRLRLELTAAAGLAPHPALQSDPLAAGHYLFEQGDLGAVSTWLQLLRDRGEVLDFRIGPPTLDDIYTATVGEPRARETEPAEAMA
jgi:ABC-type multidrug transport system ATPase subunit